MDKGGRTFGFRGSPGAKRMRKGSMSDFSSIAGGMSSSGSNSWTAVDVERMERASAGNDMTGDGHQGLGDVYLSPLSSAT